MNLLSLATLLAEDPAPRSGGLTQMFIMLGGVVVIFYFIAWRPQAKERRAREEMLKAIKSGDPVLTTSGIFAVVSSVKEDHVILKLDEKGNVKVRFSRAAIQAVLPKGGAAKETAEST